ncbi:MAG: SRPBCC domain-containing protein [Acidimicrobiia bacterium]
MTEPTVHKDPDALTMTITTDLDVPVERAWQLWADPRQLERWWGPPTYPATVVDHDLVAGGKVSYFMTGPEGDRAHGWWDVVAAEPPSRLELRDGFAHDDGRPDDARPVTVMTVSLSARDGGSRMDVVSRFPSLEAMEELVAMGMEEGMVAALGQIAAILADDAATTS